MVEKTKVYFDKMKAKYGSANVPDTKNKPINKESKVIYDSGKALDDFTNEPSKVSKPINFNNANELKARFSAREIRRRQMIEDAKAIGDSSLVKTLEAESITETQQIEKEIFRINSNKKIGEAIDRDLRRHNLEQKAEDEFLTVSEIEEDWEDLDND